MTDPIIDEQEDIPSSPPEPEAEPDSIGEPAAAHERIRPGLKSMGTKVFAGLVLSALLPVLIFIVVIWALQDHSTRISGDAAEAYKHLHTQAVDLASRVQQLQQELTQAHKLQADAAKASHHRKVQTEITTLTAKLRALLADKDSGQIQTDTQIQAALRSADDALLEAALLDPEAKSVVALRSKTKPGSITKVLPELGAAMASRKSSPPLSEPGWHWTSIGKTGYLLAVRPEPSDLPDSPKLVPSVTLPGAERLEGLTSFHSGFTTRAWILSVGLPLLALLLAMVVFLWIRQGLLAPLRGITLGARQILEKPAESNEHFFASPGVLEDLAATLARLQTRMCRLSELDTLLARTRQQLSEIHQVVDTASDGDLSMRIQTGPGDCARVSASVNRLLDVSAERFETIRQASAHMASSADRLRSLATKLTTSMLPNGSDRTPMDPGALGDILGMQLESLCKSTSELTSAFIHGAPGIRSAEERQRQTSTIGSSGVGLKILVQRAHDLREMSDRLGSLRQQAEVLSTNLAIAAEARSFTQLEKMVDNGHSLAKAISGLSESLGKGLQRVVQTGEETESLARMSREQGAICAEQLHDWELHFESLSMHKDDLLRQVETLRPAASTLGAEVRRLLESYTGCRQSLLDKQETLRKISDGSRALGNTAEETLAVLKRVETAHPAPAAITRSLAEQQKSLERAIRDLSDFASAEGIDALSGDAQAILNLISQTAAEARLRIQNRPEVGSESSA